METYIKKAEDLESVKQNFVPYLLDAVLLDYEQNVPAARDAEVLNLMATVTARLQVCINVIVFVICLTPTYRD